MPIKSPTRLYDNIENELLREQLLATSAESPAEAFVKRLLNPSPASRSKTEELLREQLAASESRAAAEELATSETRAAAAEERLESFKESAELAALTSQNKQSALNHDAPAKEAASQSEIEPPGEQLAASEATVAALRASSPSSFARYAAKAVQQQHRRLSCVHIFWVAGEPCYNPATRTSLRVPSAFPTPGAAPDRSSASQAHRLQRDHRPDPDRDRPAHGADVPASSLRVPDARRGARPTLGVVGAST